MTTRDPYVRVSKGTDQMTLAELTDHLKSVPLATVYDLFAESASSLQGVYGAAHDRAANDAERNLWLARMISVEKFKVQLNERDRPGILKALAEFNAEFNFRMSRLTIDEPSDWRSAAAAHNRAVLLRAAMEEDEYEGTESTRQMMETQRAVAAILQDSSLDPDQTD